MSETIGDALPAEMRRVREEVMSVYQSLGQPAAFALAMMNASLSHAERAMIDGDLVEMMRAYSDLRDYKL